MKTTWAAILLMAAFNFFAMLPNVLEFGRFAFGDSGWALTVDAMLADGKVPTKDFAYFYGLFTLFVDRAWLAVFGRTPEAVVYLYAACNLGVAVGVIRIVRAMELGRVARFLVVVATPVIITPGFIPSPAHALEALFLVNALAAQAEGRRGQALALVTVAVFVKPSLGYVYGLVLLVQILAGLPERALNRLRLLVPAAVVGVVIAAILAIAYGPGPLIRTQIPLGAGEAYQEAKFGFFFGVGKEFWLPSDLRPAYYFKTSAGAWLLATVILTAGTIFSVPFLKDCVWLFIATCGVLHLVFVCFLFGNQWSWIYYPYLPFLGAAVVIDRLTKATSEAISLVGKIVGVLLIVLIMFLDLVLVVSNGMRLWNERHRSPMTGNLFSTKSDREDWDKIRQIAQKENVFVLNRMGCANLLTPGVSSPRAWCLTRATMTPAELEDVRAGLAKADLLVVPNWHDNDLMTWPEFAEELKPFVKTGEVELYTVYRRVPKPGG